ncbi:DUF3280 domain-containing protein [Rubellimicrobium sp. CFH 75288]|uniref:DUF3280 domain-containing protein n=1 Tax=Rubellimicrobium sp. CFH 75288 TaxID=2697034 RepID=UPI001413167A|nr:DUF3280 domain-containing protein [Rubellimicrobium sp. CFH 75288]NAZ37910.1 DUF2380 domain-containing protein [Rubellimicrobium sp. CFH 75288]
MRHLLLLLLLFVAGPASALEALRPGAKVAFFGITFLDTSLEGELAGPREDETARLALLEDLVRQRFETEGFDLVALDPVAEELARTRNPADCNGCDLRMGARLGADYALVGEVQKVSNLILSMNLALREVESGRLVRMLAVDIRSNTDESWLRGGRYILDRHVFAPPAP